MGAHTSQNSPRGHILLPGVQKLSELMRKAACQRQPGDQGPRRLFQAITDLEPDILECEAKWALGSITKNKASGGDGILIELFQILKYDAVQGLHSIRSEEHTSELQSP